MERYERRLLDFVKEDLDELISNITVKHEITNKEYKKLLEKRKNIIQKHNGLMKVFDDYEVAELTDEELKILPELVSLESDILDIEQKAIYKEAMLDCIDILKELNILKTE